MSKTYWGLNEIEVNKLWKMTDKYKNTNGIYLSLEVKIQAEDNYQLFFNKVKNDYPDFIEEDLFKLEDKMEEFKKQDEYDEYYEYSIKKENQEKQE
jgi:methionyl-tRNA formyltransferase